MRFELFIDRNSLQNSIFATASVCKAISICFGIWYTRLVVSGRHVFEMRIQFLSIFMQVKANRLRGINTLCFCATTLMIARTRGKFYIYRDFAAKRSYVGLGVTDLIFEIFNVLHPKSRVFLKGRHAAIPTNFGTLLVSFVSRIEVL